jgi:hypothetical protein
MYHIPGERYIDDVIVRYGISPGAALLQKPFSADVLAEQVHALLSAGTSR